MESRKNLALTMVKSLLINFLNSKNIDFIRGMPYNPHSQGVVERFHQTLKDRIHRPFRTPPSAVNQASLYPKNHVFSTFTVIPDISGKLLCESNNHPIFSSPCLCTTNALHSASLLFARLFSHWISRSRLTGPHSGDCGQPAPAVNLRVIKFAHLKS